MGVSLNMAPSPPEEGPASIPMTPAEAAGRRYTRAKLQEILEKFHEDGFIVLEDVVSIDHIDAISNAMDAETPKILASQSVQFNHGVLSNILQCAPLTPDLVFEDVYLNPFVIQVVNAYLGARPRWNFITGNNALAGTKGMRQPVHKDIAFRIHPTSPFYVIANVLMDDFSPENGSTEFWLGTHKNTTADDQDTTEGKTCNVLPDRIEARRKVRPPVQVRAKKGSITLRDLRTWHAGMPNPSEKHRIMIALGYQARWYPNYTQRLKLPESQMNFFVHDDIEIMANFVSDEEVAAHQHKYNFHFGPSI